MTAEKSYIFILLCAFLIIAGYFLSAQAPKQYNKPIKLQAIANYSGLAGREISACNSKFIFMLNFYTRYMYINHVECYQDYCCA